MAETPTSATVPGVRSSRSRSFATATSASDTCPRANAGCTPYLRRNAQGFVKEQFQPRPAQSQFGRKIAAGANLSHDFHFPHRGGIQSGRHQEEVLACALALPGLERALRFSGFRCPAHEQFVDQRAYVPVV